MSACHTGIRMNTISNILLLVQLLLLYLLLLL
jgi:hypothetical protein